MNVLRLRQFKPVSIAFVICQLLDVATTLIGFAIIPGMVELNPIANHIPMMVSAKICGIVLAVYILERVRAWPRLIWIVPGIGYLVVAWNILNIATSL